MCKQRQQHHICANNDNSIKNARRGLANVKRRSPCERRYGQPRKVQHISVLQASLHSMSPAPSTGMYESGQAQYEQKASQHSVYTHSPVHGTSQAMSMGVQLSGQPMELQYTAPSMGSPPGGVLPAAFHGIVPEKRACFFYMHDAGCIVKYRTPPTRVFLFLASDSPFHSNNSASLPAKLTRGCSRRPPKTIKFLAGPFSFPVIPRVGFRKNENGTAAVRIHSSFLRRVLRQQNRDKRSCRA